MTFNTGKVINNRYRVVHLLAEGGFGAVYKAWNITINEPCALKINLDSSPEAQRQFEREAEILGSLSHPNLPRVTDHFFVPGQGQFLVMDYVEGVDLQTLVEQRGRVSEEQTLAWIGQIVDALTYLHSQPQPIIHRDIKPANIRITPQDQAVLVDFGLVKVYDHHLKTTMGARAVTPGYSPPEQYGQGNTDARTDTYALAATVYTLLTGKEPQESVLRIVDDQVVPASTVAPDTSANTSAVLAKGMALRPTERYQTAIDFRDALRPLPGVRSKTTANTQSIGASNSGHDGGQHSRSKSNSRFIWFSGLGILAAAAAIGLQIAFVQPLAFRQFLPRVSQVQQETAPPLATQELIETQAQVTGVAERSLERQANATATAEIRATKTARAEATTLFEQEFTDMLSRVEEEQELVFEAASGSLAHKDDDLIETDSANVSLKNFVAEARFLNPYGSETGDWDYGFLFRDIGGNNQLRLTIAAQQGSGNWDLSNRKDVDSEYIDGGPLDLNDGEGEANLIKLIAEDDHGLLFVNDVFISELDLSSRASRGNVLVATGMFNGNEIDGEETGFEDLTVWSLHKPFGEITAAQATGDTSKVRWETFSSFNSITDIFLDENTLWAATDGGLVKWDTDDGSYQTISVDDGLPSNDLWAVFVDLKGQLWVGSQSTGLARFDDGNWTIVADETILGSNSVQDIVEDNDGNLWVGTQDAGAARFDGNNWERFTLDNSTVDWHVARIFIDEDGSIWFGSGEKFCIPCGGELAHFDGVNWESFGRDDGLPGWDNQDEADVWSMLRVPNGDLWAGTPWGIYRLENGFWEPVSDNDESIKAMVPDDDTVWAGGWDPGIAQYDISLGQLKSKERADELDSITELIMDMDGSIWAGSSRGLHNRSQSGVWSYYWVYSTLMGVRELAETADGFPLVASGNKLWHYQDSNWQPYLEGYPNVGWLSTLNFDDAGRLWAGGDGIAWFDEGQWHSEWREYDVNQIVQSKDGALWFNTQYEGVVLRLDSGEWTVYSYEDGDLPGDYVYDIYPGADDGVWLSTSGGAVWIPSRTEPAQWHVFNSDNRLKFDEVGATFEDSQGRVWFASRGYEIMVRLADGSWRHFEDYVSWADHFIEDSQGAIFVGGNGLSMYKDGEWIPVLSDINVSDMILAHDGTIWVATYGDGVCHIVGEKPTCYRSQNTNLASNNAYDLIEDGDHTIWINTEGGLSHLILEN